MPFTPSHAAAVLPFLRTPLPASALVIGSMAPDVPYYLPGRPALYTHTALSVVTTDVLLGLLLWALWHGLLAAPALAAAPAALRARISDPPLGLRRRLHVRVLALTVLALALGAGTHVLWDEFTHAGRWGTQHIPALVQTWGPLAGYRWLQYASGLVGGAILVVWFALWWRRTPARPVPQRPTPWWVWAVVAVAGAVAGIAAAAVAAPGIGSRGFAGATWGGFAAAVIAVLLAAGWHLRRR
jgi:hypothetical protein